MWKLRIGLRDAINCGFAALVCAGAVVAYRADGLPSHDAHPAVQTALDPDEFASLPYLVGNGQDQYGIVEFADFQCPFCRATRAATEQFIESQRKGTSWQLCVLPIPGHKLAVPALKLALAAVPSNQFKPVCDWLMTTKLTPGVLAAKTSQLGNNAGANRLQALRATDSTVVGMAQVSATPTFLILDRSRRLVFKSTDFDAAKACLATLEQGS